MAGPATAETEQRSSPLILLGVLLVGIGVFELYLAIRNVSTVTALEAVFQGNTPTGTASSVTSGPSSGTPAAAVNTAAANTGQQATSAFSHLF